MFRPLDLVLTPGGVLAMVIEVSPWGDCQIEFLTHQKVIGEKVAWWNESDGLIIMDSIPRLLTRAMCHPSGNSARNPNYPESMFPVGVPNA